MSINPSYSNIQKSELNPFPGSSNNDKPRNVSLIEYSKEHISHALENVTTPLPYHLIKKSAESKVKKFRKNSKKDIPSIHNISNIDHTQLSVEDNTFISQSQPPCLPPIVNRKYIISRKRERKPIYKMSHKKESWPLLLWD